MDAYEAIMARIQSLDPENASKIMGYILIQDQGEKEMTRLAFGPEALLLPYINQAKACLGLNAFPQRPFSYAAALNGSDNSAGAGSPRLHFYGGGQCQSPFVDYDSSDPALDFRPSLVHRRSCSVNDAPFLSNLEDGIGSKTCMFFARGHCKNGTFCKFLHGGGGSPIKNSSGFDELLRMKALQQQRLPPMNLHPFPFNKCLDLLNEIPSFQRAERSDFGLIGCSNSSSSSRQIYLTFPADSSFKEDDVSSYFSTFGPVQDVRIPYQQRRMFGFVTFLYPETVKLILAKGNPHFVCDSRVLVKPYKEKAKILEKKQQQQQFHLERDIDLLISQEMLLRRKLEQEAELQHAIELQGRMMNLQMMDLKNQLLLNHNSADAIFLSEDQKLEKKATESSDAPESLEHILPDNLFASPTKSASENRPTAFSQASVSASSNNNLLLARSH